MKKGQLNKLIKNIWQNEIKTDFVNIGFMWERHLQAVLYFHLRSRLSEFNNVDTWIEPVFKIGSGKNEVKPDILITEENEITAIIELKFKPWEFPHYHQDINKLITYQKYLKSIPLQAIPISSNWEIQKKNRLKSYKLSSDCLMIFAVLGKADSSALTLEDIKDLPTNFLHLTGVIKSETDIEFK